MFKIAKLKLPFDRRDIRYWVEQDLTEDKAQVLVNQIENSRCYRIQYVRDTSTKNNSRNIISRF
jgi:hypothetical protein